MILYDFSGSVHAAIHVDVVQNKTFDVSKDFIRHLILSQIVNIKKKFGEEYGNIIVCLDNPSNSGYWRKDIFPYYKAARKLARENSEIDWKTVYGYINDITTEMKEYLPYDVISVPKCEADDIIATLTLNQPWNKSKTFFDTDEKVLIVSNDKDFRQLHDIENVVQYIPRDTKIVKESDPKLYLFEQIIRGDSIDGIPNIKSSPETIITEGMRQSRITTKYIKTCLTEGIPISENDRFNENNLLINLRCIPEEISKLIIDTYDNTTHNTNKMKLYMYLTQNNLKKLCDDVDKF